MGSQQYYLDTVLRIKPCRKSTNITVGVANDEVSYLDLWKKGWKQGAFESLIILNSFS